MTQQRRAQVGRSITYELEGSFQEASAERLLAAAKTSGLVLEYDTGRGSLMWFQGKPGQELRDLKKKLQALIKDKS